MESNETFFKLFEAILNQRGGRVSRGRYSGCLSVAPRIEEGRILPTLETNRIEKKRKEGLFLRLIN